MEPTTSHILCSVVRGGDCRSAKDGSSLSSSPTPCGRWIYCWIFSGRSAIPEIESRSARGMGVAVIISMPPYFGGREDDLDRAHIGREVGAWIHAARITCSAGQAGST